MEETAVKGLMENVPCLEAILFFFAVLVVTWMLHEDLYISWRSIFMLFLYVLFAVYFIVYSPRLISLMHKAYTYFFGKSNVPSDYLTFMGTVLPSSVSIIISAVALMSSRKKEGLSVEVSKDVLQRYIETSCQGFGENAQGNTFSYYKLKPATYIRHIDRLNQNGILMGEKRELCDKLNSYTQKLKNMQISEDIKMKNKALEACTKFCQKIQNGQYEPKKEVAEILEELS